MFLMIRRPKYMWWKWKHSFPWFSPSYMKYQTLVLTTVGTIGDVWFEI